MCTADQSTYFFASNIHTGDKVLHCSDTAMDVDDLSLQSDTMDIRTNDEAVPCSDTAMEVELEVINLSLQSEIIDTDISQNLNEQDNSLGNNTTNKPTPIDAFDVGNLTGSSCVRLADQDKYQYLKHHFSPETNYTGFLKQTITKGKSKKQYTLSFQHSWLKQYPWLVYTNVVHQRWEACVNIVFCSNQKTVI